LVSVDTKFKNRKVNHEKTIRIFPGIKEPAAEFAARISKDIAATPKLINNSKQVICIVTESNKAEKATQIIEKKEGSKLLPATFVNPTDGELIGMLDESAGQLLS